MMFSVADPAAACAQPERNQVALRDDYLQTDFQALVDSSLEGVILHQDGMVRYANNAAAKLFCASEPGELIGQCAFSIWGDSDDLEIMRSRTAAILRGATLTPHPKMQLRLPDGQTKWIRTAASLVQWSDRPAVASFLTDVTDQVHSESALRAAEERFEDLFENSPDMSCSVDALSARVVECNQTLCDELGFTKDEVIGRPVLSFYAPESQTKARDCFSEFQRTGNVKDAELVLERKDGSLLDVSLNVSAVRDSQGAVIRSRSTWRDISARKKAERSLREADSRKDEFLAMLAHELRNPLVPIRTSADLILASTERTDDRSPARMIRSQVNHLARMVDDLTEVSRITRGEITLRKELVSLQALVNDAVQSCQENLEERQHAVSVSLPDELVLITVDVTRMGQVLSNLINNAGRYTQPGGQIGIAAEVSGDRICIAVEDDGCGLSPEELPKLFELFYQSPRKLDRSDGGLGIGLTVVNKLVDLHGGNVEIQSGGIGLGSRFAVSLPMNTEAKEGLRPRSEEVKIGNENSQDLKVLIVDDNQAVRESLSLLLDLYGFVVKCESDGPTALNTVSAFRPDIVLLDIGLPGMDGFEVARRIRSLEISADIKLIAITGYGSDQHVRNTMNAGFDAHFLKSSPNEELLKMLVPTRFEQGKSA